MGRINVMGAKKSVGTAVAAEVLVGKTFDNASATDVVGTMPNIGSIGTQNLTTEGAEYTIAAGYHNGAGKVKAVITNLTAANIKAGVTLGGVAGTFTNDANAVAGDILSTKTAYVNGNKITGTIASKGAQTFTPTTSNQTIAANQYLTGVQTIEGSVNLTAANLKVGVSMFGVTGTFTNDANAVAGDILSTKTAYVNGTKITGNIALRTGDHQNLAMNVSGTTLKLLAPAGYYNGSNGYVTVPDSNFIASNIRAGVNIFSLTGTLAVASGTTVVNAIASANFTAGQPVSIADIYTFDTVDVISTLDSIPDQTTKGISISNDGKYLAVASFTAPYLFMYVSYGNTFKRVYNIDILPTAGSNYISFSPDGMYLVVEQMTSPFINIYKRNGDFFNRITGPTVYNSSIGISPDSVYFAFGTDSSPFINIYKRSGDTFTKLANPASLPTGRVDGIAFSPDNTYLAVGHLNSPFITIYKRSGDTFTKLANPASLPAGGGNKLAFSSDGTYLAVPHFTSPFLSIYKRSGDTFTKLTNPVSMPNNTGRCAKFIDSDNYLVISYASSPYVIIYKRNGDTFTKLANPATLPTGESWDIDISPSKHILGISHANAPYITLYRPSFLEPRVVPTGSLVTNKYSVGYINSDVTAGSVASVTRVLNDDTLRGLKSRSYPQLVAESINARDLVKVVSKYNFDTMVKLDNPIILPTASAYSVSFSKDNNYLAVGHGNSPFITIYKRNGDTFTKLDDPASLPPGAVFAVAFSKDNNYLAVGYLSSPRIAIYKRSGDTFTKLANPASLPISMVNDVVFSNDNTYLVASHQGMNYITIYKRSGDTFTKLSDPASLPAGNSNGVAFSNDDVYLAVAHNTSPFITIYKRSGDTFTKLANPASLPTGIGYSVSFSNDDVYLVVGHDTSPFITIYKRSGDTFTKLANPASLPSGPITDISFSRDNNYLVVVSGYSPYIIIYKRNGDTFTRINNSINLPGGGGGVEFNIDDQYLAIAHQGTSPCVIIYKPNNIIGTKLVNINTKSDDVLGIGYIDEVKTAEETGQFNDILPITSIKESLGLNSGTIYEKGDEVPSANQSKEAEGVTFLGSCLDIIAENDDEVYLLTTSYLYKFNKNLQELWKTSLTNGKTLAIDSGNIWVGGGASGSSKYVHAYNKSTGSLVRSINPDFNGFSQIAPTSSGGGGFHLNNLSEYLAFSGYDTVNDHIGLVTYNKNGTKASYQLYSGRTWDDLQFVRITDTNSLCVYWPTSQRYWNSGITTLGSISFVNSNSMMSSRVHEFDRLNVSGAGYITAFYSQSGAIVRNRMMNGSVNSYTHCTLGTGSTYAGGAVSQDGNFVSISGQPIMDTITQYKRSSSSEMLAVGCRRFFVHSGSTWKLSRTVDGVIIK